MKVGIVGLGAMGRNHLRVLQEFSQVRAISVFDPFLPDDAFDLRTNVFREWTQFIESGLDYCVVSSPTSSHEELAGLLGHAGIPTLIEKPLAASAASAQALVQCFESTRTLAAVGHIERFNPAVSALRKVLRSGELGEITQIITKRVGPFSGRIKDVGVVMDLATHDIDLVMWLTGFGYSEISADIASPLGNQHEDALSARGTLGDDISVSHEVSWVSESKERTLTVLTGSGEIFADLLGGEVKVLEFSGFSQGRSKSPVNQRFESVKNLEPLVSEHLAFQKAISTGNLGNLASLRDGLDVVTTAEKMLRR